MLDMILTFHAAVVPLHPPSQAAHFFIGNANGLLVVEDETCIPSRIRLPSQEEARNLGADIAPAHYLGRLAEDDCFALFWPNAAPLPAGFSISSLRKLYGRLPDDLLTVAGRALQIVHWEDTHRFCGRCATPLVRLVHERAMRCPQCELTVFPRVSPAVIVLVRRGPQALLARAARFPTAMYSTLAGFVEPGETLEQTVMREIQEEVGITVKNLRYFGSQPWPFPHSLMVGFMADYAAGELRADGQEIVDARFFDADALPLLPPALSIARKLINAWLYEQSQPSNTSA